MASDFEDLWSDGATALMAMHGEAITQYPLGNTAAAVVIAQAVVLLDQEENGPIDDAHGSQRKRRGWLTLPAAIAVNVVARKQDRDEFLVRGLLWVAEDIESEDTQLQVVRITRTEAGSTTKSRVR